MTSPQNREYQITNIEPNISRNKFKHFYRKELQNQNDELIARLGEQIRCMEMQLLIIGDMIGGNQTEKDSQVDGIKENEEPDAEVEQDNEDALSSDEGELRKCSSKLSTKSSTLSGPPTASSFYSPPPPCPHSQSLNLQALITNITLVHQNLSQQLLQKQIQLQHEQQQAHILELYEKRVHELQAIKIGKENDISCDHIGLWQEKLKQKQFRQFEEQCIEIVNVKGMWSKLSKLRNEVNQIQRATGNTPLMELRADEVSNQDDNEQQITNLRKCLGKENKLDIVLKNQQKFQKLPSNPNTFNDPFFKRILRNLKSQLARQKSLQDEYSSLALRLQELSKQHTCIAKQYTNKKPHKLSGQIR